MVETRRVLLLKELLTLLLTEKYKESDSQFCSMERRTKWDVLCFSSVLLKAITIKCTEKIHALLSSFKVDGALETCHFF